MTDTHPKCEICGADMVKEIRERCIWIVTTNGVRGGSTTSERIGWDLERWFECGATIGYSAKNKTESRGQCPEAHELALKLKARVAELEAEVVPPIPEGVWLGDPEGPV